MSNKNPREILAELIQLRNHAGASLYTRLKLAKQLLADRAWVEDPSGGGGDASRAIDRIEQDCFGPEAGMSLPQMLEVLAAVPQESAWKQHRYNLYQMWQEMKDRQQAGRRMTTAPAPEATDPEPAKGSQQEEDYDQRTTTLFLEEENKRLKKELREATAKIKEQAQQINKLQKGLKRLKRLLEGVPID